VVSAAFSPDGSRIVTASYDNTARLWDAKTGAALTTLSGHTDHLDGAAFSPDSNRVVTASWDGTARIWDVKTGSTLFTLTDATSVHSAVFSPDGSRIATTSFGAQLWDARTGEALITLSAGRVRSVAFSPDGSRVITASDDGKARMWDASAGSILRARGLSLSRSAGPSITACFAMPRRLLVILGASGAGKSSFLRAYQDVVVFLPSIVLPFRHSSSCP